MSKNIYGPEDINDVGKPKTGRKLSKECERDQAKPERLLPEEAQDRVGVPLLRSREKNEEPSVFGVSGHHHVWEVRRRKHDPEG